MEALSAFVNATAQLNELQKDMDDTVVSILEALNINKPSMVIFNREYYRLDIIIGENKYYIDVNGRGADKKKYHKRLLEHIQEELNIVK